MCTDIYECIQLSQTYYPLQTMIILTQCFIFFPPILSIKYVQRAYNAPGTMLGCRYNGKKKRHSPVLMEVTH